jgi:hypothetical protein
MTNKHIKAKFTFLVPLHVRHCNFHITDKSILYQLLELKINSINPLTAKPSTMTRTAKLFCKKLKNAYERNLFIQDT